MEKPNYVRLVTQRYEPIVIKKLNQGPIFTFIEKINNTLIKGVAKVFYYGLLMIPFIINFFLIIKNPSATKISEKLESLKQTDNICKLVFLRAQYRNAKEEVWVKKQAYEEQLVALRAVNDKLDEEFEVIQNEDQRLELTEEKWRIEDLKEKKDQEEKDAERIKEIIEKEYSDFEKNNFPHQRRSLKDIGWDILSDS